MTTKQNKTESYFDKEMACDHQDKIVCPHCRHENSTEYFFDGFVEDNDNEGKLISEIECSSCEKTFTAWLDKYNQNLGYSSRPIACKEHKHKFVFERSFNQGKENEGNELRCVKCWESKYQWTKNGKVLSRRNIDRQYRQKEEVNQVFEGLKEGNYRKGKNWFSVSTKEAKGNRFLFLSLIEYLKSLGFKLTEMKKLNRYPTLKFSHRDGLKSGISFEASYYPAGMKIDLCLEGESKYSSDKKPSYLQSKLITFTLSKLESKIKELGKFTLDHKDVDWHGRPNLDNLTREQARKKLLDFNIPTPKEAYNNKDKDGVELKSGDVRYSYNYNKELIKGIAKHNINNMWWLITADNYYNISSRELFSIKEDTPVKLKEDQQSRLKTELAIAIKNEDFKRCITLKKMIDGEKK